MHPRHRRDHVRRHRRHPGDRGIHRARPLRRLRLHRHRERRHRGSRRHRRRDDRRVHRGDPDDLRRARGAPHAAASHPGSGAGASSRGWDEVRLGREPDADRRGRRPDAAHRDAERRPAGRDAGHPDAGHRVPVAARDAQPEPSSTGCYRRAAASGRGAGHRASVPVPRVRTGPWQPALQVPAAPASGRARVPGRDADPRRPVRWAQPERWVQPERWARPAQRVPLPQEPRVRPERAWGRGAEHRASARRRRGHRASQPDAERSPHLPACLRTSSSPTGTTPADDAQRAPRPSRTPTSRTRPAP